MAARRKLYVSRSTGPFGNLSRPSDFFLSLWSSFGKNENFGIEGVEYRRMTYRGWWRLFEMFWVQSDWWSGEKYELWSGTRDQWVPILGAGELNTLVRKRSSLFLDILKFEWVVDIVWLVHWCRKRSSPFLDIFKLEVFSKGILTTRSPFVFLSYELILSCTIVPLYVFEKAPF